MEQLPAPGQDILLQLAGIGDGKAFLCLGQTAVPVIHSLTGEQVVPHTGGVGAAGLKPLHHLRHIGGERIQIPIEDIYVGPIAEPAVVLVLPEVVANFHHGAVPGQDGPARIFRDRSLAIEIHVIVGGLVIMRPGTGAAQGKGFHLVQCAQLIKQSVYHIARVLSSS